MGIFGQDRMDCGLGGSWREIMDNVDELQSQQVLMRSLVLRPPQELIAQLEEVDPELWARRREVSRGRRVSDPRPLGAPMDY